MDYDYSLKLIFVTYDISNTVFDNNIKWKASLILEWNPATPYCLIIHVCFVI